MAILKDLWSTVRKPHSREVFFPSLPTNRSLLLWYAGKIVDRSSEVDPADRLLHLDALRKQGQSFTFICNHLTYADSHIVETMMIRCGARDLADHMIHIAGQKTYEVYRYFMTRSLNTVRVYQPKADVDPAVRRRMNLRALKWAAHQKRRGYSLIVFPEGTRTRRHTRFNLHAANPKSTMYFRHSQVVPMGLMGAEKILPLGGALPRRAAVRLRVGEPIRHSELEQEYRKKYPDLSERDLRKALMLHYMEQINHLLDPEYRSAEGGKADQL